MKTKVLLLEMSLLGPDPLEVFDPLELFRRRESRRTRYQDASVKSLTVHALQKYHA
ncbi:MAG: hypothetical protein IT440_11265 [Phycisphaeraceae bacterium]|nr:hypothetical protein [Phycisphaeraceae bacterium]